MSSVRKARADTEGERLNSTSQHLVTHRDRVVHRFAQSGFARRCTGVQSLGYGLGPHAGRVIESRFEAVISMHSNRRSLVRAVAVVTVVAALTTACSSAATPPTQSPTSSIASPSPSTTSPSPSPTAEAATAALASYSSYWTAKVASFADPASKPDPKLASFAIDKALAEAHSTLLVLRRAGIAMQGQPGHSAQATAVKLGDPSTVTIEDCLDSTKWTPVYVATGKSALAPGQATHVIVDSLATVYNGRWVIRESITHKDRPC